MSVQKFRLDAPYAIGAFKYHAELKDQILDAISKQPDAERLQEVGDAVDISLCDWKHSRFDYNKPWLQILRPKLFEHLDEQTSTLGYKQFKIKEIWFQQYEQNSLHGWHVHGSNWTNVYFLELPEGCPKTQFINPFNQTDIAEFDIKEGDILTFPSFVIHRAPVNTNTQRKTIISWNMDLELSPGMYTE